MPDDVRRPSEDVLDQLEQLGLRRDDPDVGEATAADDGDLILSPGAPLPSARAFIARNQTHQTGRTLHHQGGAFYKWRKSHYMECAAEEMRAALYGFLDGAKRYGDGKKLIAFEPNRAKVANILEAVAAESQLPGSTRAPAWLDGCKTLPADEMIACTNGLLHLPTESMHPHNAAFFTLNALGFDYQPKAPAPAAWLAFLQTVWPGDQQSIDTLQELFGLLLTADTRHQKAFLLVGPKRSGKGTIARVLTQMLGPDNVCGPTLGGLATNFGLAPLIGKRLALISDARLGKTDPQVIVERLLSVTGEDALTVDRKFRDCWTGKLDARFVILTNEMPRLTDSSGALASRFVILKLAESFYGREDLGLGNRLTPELPGILRWSIDGWRRLQARGYFVMPESAKGAQREMEDLGSPIGAFIRDRCTLAPGKSVRADELYRAWCDWCRDQGRDHPGTVQTFGRDLSAAVSGLSTSNRRDLSPAGRSRYYDGIGLTAGSQALRTSDEAALERGGTRSAALCSYFSDDPGYQPYNA